MDKFELKKEKEDKVRDLMYDLLAERKLTDQEIEDLSRELNIKKDRLKEIDAAIWIVIRKRIKDFKD